MWLVREGEATCAFEVCSRAFSNLKNGLGGEVRRYVCGGGGFVCYPADVISAENLRVDHEFIDLAMCDCACILADKP